MSRPYSRSELNQPGIRLPIDSRRVMATAEALDQLGVESSSIILDQRVRIAALEAALRQTAEALEYLWDECCIDFGHEEACPEDDTCDCEAKPRIDKFNAALEAAKAVLNA